MLIVIGIPLLTILVILLFTRKLDIGERFLMSFMGLITSLFITFWIGVGVGAYLAPDEKVSFSASTEKLTAIRDGGQTEGSFFLGTGSIDGVMYVHYFIQKEDGGYNYGKVELEKVTIYEDSEGIATKEVIKECSQDSTNQWLGLYFGGCKSILEFHVPKGSVDKSYKLDLE